MPVLIETRWPTSDPQPEPAAAAQRVHRDDAVEAILQTLRETSGMTEVEGFDSEHACAVAVFASEDAKEGPKAFAEKRTPTFHRR
jgi:enoyl-CoA hydratase/carnithine racemase